MFEARLTDGTPIDVDQFRHLEGAEGLALCCMGCSAQVLAVAWKPNVQYRRTSHFRLSPGHRHETGCPIEAYEEFVDSGNERTVQSASDIPGGYPSRLVFRKQPLLTQTDGHSDDPVKDRYVYADGRQSAAPRSIRSGNTTSSLLQVCRFYVNVPEAANLPFEADGLMGFRYKEVIQSLHLIATERVLPPRIYFGPLLFKIKPEASSNALLLTLAPKIKGDNERRYQLQIDWQHWSEVQRSNFQSQLEEKRAFLREQWFRERQSSNSLRSCLYVFFIGDQSRENLAIFRVNDPRKVCVLPSSYTVAQSRS